MKDNKTTFAFWGTPEVASKTLQILIDQGLLPSLVITNPDRKQGRGLTLTPTPVKVLAEKHNIPVLAPEKIDAEFIQKLRSYDLELNVVVAYGVILPTEVIDMPEHGTLNIHYSLLPKYRGASPLESALLNGDTETGVTIQKMVKKLDAGDIVAFEKVSIDNTTTKDELRETLIQTGAQLLIKTIPNYIKGSIIPTPQDEADATHCAKVKKEDGLIDPYGDAQKNYNKYRAYSGWPGIYFFENGKRIKVTSAHLEDGKFVIERVIPEGKKETIWK